METNRRLLGWDGRVARDELREDAAESLDSQRQQGHVQEKDVGDVAGKDAALYGSSHGDGFLRVHALA